MALAEPKPYRYAFIYIRVSTKKQSDFMKGHVSMDAQEETCVNWAKANGYEYDIYRETVSARRMEKQRELAYIKRNLCKGDTLVVYNVSRFSRNMMNAMATLRVISNIGANFHSVSEGFDYSTHQGRQMIHMSLAGSQFESEEISARVRRSLAMRRERGDFIGKATFGWRCERLHDGRRVRVLDRDEALLAVRIMDMNDGVDLEFGMQVLGIGQTSLKARIATQLNQEGTTCRGKPWTAELVKRVLRNANELRNVLVGAQREQIQPFPRMQRVTRPQRRSISDHSVHQGMSGVSHMSLRNADRHSY